MVPESSWLVETLIAACLIVGFVTTIISSANNSFSEKVLTVFQYGFTKQKRKNGLCEIRENVQPRKTRPAFVATIDEYLASRPVFIVTRKYASSLCTVALVEILLVAYVSMGKISTRCSSGHY
jgi:hypothetical protein